MPHPPDAPKTTCRDCDHFIPMSLEGIGVCANPHANQKLVELVAPVKALDLTFVKDVAENSLHIMVDQNFKDCIFLNKD